MSEVIQMADEYIRLDTTIVAIDNLINEAATGTMVRTLFKAKDTIYNQQRYVMDVQPVKHGKWLSKCEGDIYEFSECSECGNMESCETPYCAQCGARMDLKDGDAE